MDNAQKSRRVVLNGWRMGTKEKAHAHLKRRLHFPDYYGANLDALCDCLTDIRRPTELVLVNAAYMKKRLGDYGTRLLSAMMAATAEDACLRLTVRDGLL